MFISRVGSDVHGDYILKAMGFRSTRNTSAVYIHGLRKGYPIDVTLYHAQKFAGKVIGLRGATTPNLLSDIYRFSSVLM